MRRRWPVVLVAVGLVTLLASYVIYSQRVVRELRSESARTSRMFAKVFGALTDPSDAAGTNALFELVRDIRELGVPVIVTDTAGAVTVAANLPFSAPPSDRRVRDYVRVLDRQNRPVAAPGVGVVHYGNTPLVAGLRVIPLMVVGIVALLVVMGAIALRERSRADRELVWAGMARESAHQLGTPISSLYGWLELLDEQGGDPLVAKAAGHMKSDVDRLDRVARRFERIGRPPKRESLDVAAVADGVASYFRVRVPTLAQSVRIVTERPDEPCLVHGDQVLLEWAFESLVKNAIDALAGTGGTITVSIRLAPEGGAVVRVADDGPGVPRAIRRRIFAAGFSTKARGWGIGLSLTKRIIEESHDGRLALLSSERGAVFEVILPG
ncbi:MAG: HAMP domain-containing histidine kinase [Gemmatimonadaceae bacterium]|nr:HAMP domain-containing histidine kinase [Gemmatimonadaceae bacterium]